jgi:protein-disulfide isomerase
MLHLLMHSNTNTPALQRQAVMSAGIGLAALVSLACSSAQSEPRTESQGPSDTTGVLATVDGQPLTVSDLPEEVQARLKALEFQYLSQRHQLLDGAVQGLLAQRLLEEEAEKQGVSLNELVIGLTAEDISVTDEEIAAWYRRNRSRLGGRSLEELSADIERMLIDTERNRILDSHVTKLEEQKDVVLLLNTPRAELDNNNAAKLGSDRAPVTIVEFSDFECPYCRVYMETLYAIRDEYEDEVQIVFRHFPLSIHSNAPKAAEASLCALEQGKFWELHDLMFNEQRRLGVADLKEKASRLDLDQEAFASCLDSGRHAQQVALDMMEGQSFGVEGTPATFINGVPVSSGALSYDMLAEMIEQELKRLGKD